MKIQPIQNHLYNPKFTGATTPHYHINNDLNDNNENSDKPSESKSFPEWGRKGALALLVFFAIKNDPYVQNLMVSKDEQREQKARTEYFESVRKLGNNENTAPAMYHLNRFADVDNIEIQTNGREDYKIRLQLDKDTINTEISLTPISQNYLIGGVRTKDGKIIRYKAYFSKDNPDEFLVRMRNENNDTFIFGRTPKGEFYKKEGNKKVILNKKNVEKYQKTIENLPTFEEKQDLKFFTNENDLWRKLNLLLLSYLLFAEMRHDNARRKGKNKKD
jgi:hypothetical protein